MPSRCFVILTSWCFTQFQKTFVFRGFSSAPQFWHWWHWHWWHWDTDDTLRHWHPDTDTDTLWHWWWHLVFCVQSESCIERFNPDLTLLPLFIEFLSSVSRRRTASQVLRAGPMAIGWRPEVTARYTVDTGMREVKVHQAFFGSHSPTLLIKDWHEKAQIADVVTWRKSNGKVHVLV